MRLIDADALKSVPIPIEYIGEKTVWAVQTAAMGAVLKAIDKTIDDAPTIDAVSVVRCGECKYGTWLEPCQRRRCDYWTCFRNGMVYGRANTVNENDFCSYGERKEDRK